MIGQPINSDKTRVELKIIGPKCPWAGHLYGPWTNTFYKYKLKN